MAKGLRSKVKRHFRTVKRDSVAEAPWKLEAEKKRQEVLQAVLAAPKPDPPPLVAGTEPAGPSSMETDAAAAADFPELTTKNPAKIAKKLKARRLATQRGLMPAKKKPTKALAGANQFHKKKKKR